MVRKARAAQAAETNGEPEHIGPAIDQVVNDAQAATSGDIFDEQAALRQQERQAAPAQPVTEAQPEREPGDEPENEPAPQEPAGRHVAAVKRKTQAHSKLSIPAGDMVVHLIDKGDNAAGIGIRITFPDGEKNRPTEEEKEIIRSIVKGDADQPSGFSWNRDFGMWHKDIIRDGEDPREIPTSRAVAIRLDAESRVQALAEALKQHQADPVGYAETVRQQREQGVSASAER